MTARSHYAEPAEGIPLLDYGDDDKPTLVCLIPPSLGPAARYPASDVGADPAAVRIAHRVTVFPRLPTGEPLPDKAVDVYLPEWAFRGAEPTAAGLALVARWMGWDQPIDPRGLAR